MPNVRGILETAISVESVQQSAAFYRRLFGFETLLESERLIALDVAGRSVLLLFTKGATSEPFAAPGGLVPGHLGVGESHFAFAIDHDQFAGWKQRLESEGIAVESIVHWEGGAQSLYFRDPDHHLVELITPGFWRSYY